VNIAKTKWQFETDARYFLTDLALRRAQAAPGRPFRASAQDARLAKAHAKRLTFEEAKVSAARRSRRRPRPPLPESYRAEVMT
jgi:hypothetical protein